VNKTRLHVYTPEDRTKRLEAELKWWEDEQRIVEAEYKAAKRNLEVVSTALINKAGELEATRSEL